MSAWLAAIEQSKKIYLWPTQVYQTWSNSYKISLGLQPQEIPMQITPDSFEVVPSIVEKYFAFYILLKKWHL